MGPADETPAARLRNLESGRIRTGSPAARNRCLNEPVPSMRRPDTVSNRPPHLFEKQTIFSSTLARTTIRSDWLTRSSATYASYE
jgi:hypothetical protein